MALSINDIPSIATGLGVAFAAFQIRQAQQSLRDGFERTFVDRYERIIRQIDLDVILGSREPNLSDPDVCRAFFDYFELCEEELYFRAYRKVSKATWNDWWYGIRGHLLNDHFKAAFDDLAERSETSTTTPTRFRFLREAVRNLDNDSYEPDKDLPVESNTANSMA